jgi:uncharacterized protein YceK
MGGARKEGVLMLRWVAVVALAMLTWGCQTTRSFNEGCPGVYSGIRYYTEQIGDLPADGKIFFTLDLPFTVIADTLALPITSFAKPERPEHGWLPGCQWVSR